MPSGRTRKEAAEVVFHPVTSDRWKDVEILFGPRGACAGCWCMWWRLPRAEWEAGRGEGNRGKLRKIARSGKIPGLLAYIDNEPVGWCSIAPREQFPRLDSSRTLKPVDDQAVWSVVCFYTSRKHRRTGLTGQLLQAAVEYAEQQGANIVEGYPIEPRSASTPDLYAFTGIASTFRKAGFREVARRSETRPIMRLEFKRQRRKANKKI